MVFGKRPAAAATFAFDESKQQQGSGEAGTLPTTQPKKKKKAVKLKSYRHLKSPYNTNIINDPDVIPAASVENQLKNMLTAPKPSKLRKDKSKTDQADIYETFIAADMVKRVRKCWTLLCTGIIYLYPVNTPFNSLYKLTHTLSHSLTHSHSLSHARTHTHTLSFSLTHSYSLTHTHFTHSLSLTSLTLTHTFQHLTNPFITQPIRHYSTAGCPPP